MRKLRKENMLKLSICDFGEQTNKILTRFVTERLIELMDEAAYTCWFSYTGDCRETDENGNMRHIESFCPIEELMNNLDFAREVSLVYLPKSYPLEKANEAFLELYKLLRAKGEYVPELPMEYVMYQIISEELDFLKDIEDVEDDEDKAVLSPIKKISEPERSIVLEAMKEPYEQSYDPDEDTYNPEFYIYQYEDMNNYLDICFWDHDCLLLDNMTMEEIKGSLIDQWFGVIEFKDSKHYQETKLGPDGEEYVVDVELDDYPWNLE